MQAHTRGRERGRRHALTRPIGKNKEKYSIHFDIRV